MSKKLAEEYQYILDKLEKGDIGIIKASIDILTYAEKAVEEKE